MLLAVALTESVGYAQQQYLQGNCLYQRGSNQLVGCYSDVNGRLWFQYANGVVKDEKTQMQFSNDRNGTLMVWTTRGWYPAHAHPQVQQLSREIAAANQQRGVNVQVGGPGVTATPRPGEGTILTITPVFSVAELVQSQIPPHMAQEIMRSQANAPGVWNQPPPRPYYGR